MESEKQQMYKSRRKSSAVELTLGGVGRLPRVLHLEPKASAAARQESVRARPNPWQQPRCCNTRAREDGGGGSHHGCDRRAEASRRREASARRRGVGKKAAAAGAREIM